MPHRLLVQIHQALAAPSDRRARAEAVADTIRVSGGYRWVGIYQVDETEASILGWSGPEAPSHPSFPVTQGLTGAAIRSRSSIVSDDVAKDPRYLTTFGSTRSEMIVPIFNALGTVVGTIDIESDRIAAFSSEDRSLVEACAVEMLSLYEGESSLNMASESETSPQPSSPRPPIDDGAYDHLFGVTVPKVALPATTGGALDVCDPLRPFTVLFLYPMTGTPGQPMPAGWMEIPGAVGCTAQSCGYRDLVHHFEALDASVRGISTQTPEEQAEFARREKISYPLLSDSELRLKDALQLPTFEAGGKSRIKRASLIINSRRIVRIIYPIIDPAGNAADTLSTLKQLRAS